MFFFVVVFCIKNWYQLKFFSQLFCNTILIYTRKYGFIFIPCKLSQIFNSKGIKSFLCLSIPGLFQYSLEWWILEIATIIAGYINNPELSVGATVVTSQINLFGLMIAMSLGSTISYRIGKYIGAFQVDYAKRSLQVGIFLCLIISCIIGGICIIFDRKLPQLWTYDKNVISLSHNLMHILMIMQITVNTYQYLGGIYRGLGYQSIAAIIVIITYYCIALPLCLILLFVPKNDKYFPYFGWNSNTKIGTMIVWASLALGNGLAAIFLIVYLIKRVNWNNACLKGQNRMLNDESPLISSSSSTSSTSSISSPNSSKLTKDNSSCNNRNSNSNSNSKMSDTSSGNSMKGGTSGSNDSDQYYGSINANGFEFDQIYSNKSSQMRKSPFKSPVRGSTKCQKNRQKTNANKMFASQIQPLQPGSNSDESEELLKTVVL